MMNDNAYVVVFPSVFSVNKKKLLLSNIKKILKIRNQKYSEIKFDDSLIVIDANDPVFASSTINLLFGIKRIAIAKQVKNDFDTVISAIAKIGSNLLLKGETFYVEVDGVPSGYLPKDVELAATSKIIEKTSNFNVKPGTIDRHDKLLYTYITKNHAYVCIYLDEGEGGIPYNSQDKKILCCIYDELSAVSAIEAIKEGFDVKIIVCYKNESTLLNIVKMINKILPRLVQTKIDLEFFKIKANDSTGKNLLVLVDAVTKILISRAKSIKSNRISLAISPLIFPQEFIDESLKQIFQKNIIPHIPIAGMDENIFTSAKEIGLEKFLPKISKLGKIKFPNNIVSQTESQKIASQALKTKKVVSVTLGPNNIHDILDSLNIDH